jgi:hypothetical protein
MNFTELLALPSLIYLFLFFLFQWHKPWPETQFSEPIFGSFRYHLPTHKQVSSLCDATKRAMLLAVAISATKAATIPQTG